MPEEELEDIELIGLVEGTVDDLKEYVRENNLDDEELEKILRAERDAKDRKTAKAFLRNRMERRPEELKVEDERIEREELLRMLGGTVEEMKEWVQEKDPDDEQLQEILHAEKVVNDRKTAISFLKSYSKREELKEDIQEAERDFHELRNDLDRIEEVLDEDIDLSGIELEDGIEPEDRTGGEDEESGAEEDENDTEEDGEPDEKDSEEESETSEGEDEEAGGEDPEDTEGEESDDEEQDTLEKKKEIAEELDTDLSEEQLEEIPLGELKSISDEKEEREELIEFLEDDFDEEKLREASTADLKKLKQNVQESEESDPEESDKPGEEIKEEAQEDLEMLMGAVREKDDGEEKKDHLQGFKELRENISEKLSFRGGKEEEEDDNGMDKSDVIDLLDDYQELGRYESAIKTAHIMKGFLEYSEGIDRELTYRELTEEIKPRTGEMELLLDFFDDMHKDQYTGDIDADMDEVIDAAKTVVRERG